MSSKIIIRKYLPEVMAKLDELTSCLDRLSIEKDLSELIKLFASQLNRCEYCITLHTNGAMKNGVSETKLAALKDWKVSNYLSQREKTALEITESVTKDSGAKLTVEVCKKANEMFTQIEIAEIIMIASAINTWNRISVTSKTYNSLIN